ncbi:MAG: triose-phosphate isomerase [Gammaproteobacteria bacterium]|jgi:triosephosphate isomerase|nr:triose-phosphate isomerase [Gammaproteobacteria bacterium]MBT3725578.1 triose-phosphate isomerase [Gammaproteobacteria bacterium]MBT4078686.1 triose-phosphate isomerase [Gammaproteobacteria bacterium]MBT4197001.1 triose-phosphate isomerase [Gammaproteobacteria bacterium]MBT4451856.1 triose-phosphate isomerase [Gammaproteobacteria bacterium]
MRRTLIAGNWKMNGSLSSIEELISGIKDGLAEVTNADMAVCPPAIYISKVNDLIGDSGIGLGSQNICDQESGAFTGELAPSMLKEFNCSYAIIGHSERRSLYGESDELVAKRFAMAVQSGVIPLFCIGETLEERESGIMEDVVSRQIDAVIDTQGIDAIGKCVIAYEPVWAIGTGVTASPEQAQAVHAFIRSKLAALSEDVAAKVQILYGGSMNAGNAKELLSQPDIDGGLIGGAALKPADFLAIGKSA